MNRKTFGARIVEVEFKGKVYRLSMSVRDRGRMAMYSRKEDEEELLSFLEEKMIEAIPPNLPAEERKKIEDDIFNVLVKNNFEFITMLLIELGDLPKNAYDKLISKKDKMLDEKINSDNSDKKKD